MDRSHLLFTSEDDNVRSYIYINTLFHIYIPIGYINFQLFLAYPSLLAAPSIAHIAQSRCHPTAYCFGALSNLGSNCLISGTSWCKNAVNADVRRHIIAMRRCGAGSLKGMRQMPDEFGAGA